MRVKGNIITEATVGLGSNIPFIYIKINGGITLYRGLKYWALYSVWLSPADWGGRSWSWRGTVAPVEVRTTQLSFVKSTATQVQLSKEHEKHCSMHHTARKLILRRQEWLPKL